MKLANGFKNQEKRVLFTWKWIQSLVVAFDEMRLPRLSLFLLVSLHFVLRPLSEGFPILVGDHRDICSLPDNKHSGLWVGSDGRANLRLLKRKHRPRGSHMQRPHSCGGHHHKRFSCLPCRLRVALSATRYGQPLFNYSPAEMMRMIKQQSNKLGFGGDRLTWKAFKAGHAIQLAAYGHSIAIIMQAGK